MWRKKPMTCECGHARSKHSDPLRSARVGCTSVVQLEDGLRAPCRCNKSQEQVERENLEKYGERLA